MFDLSLSSDFGGMLFRFFICLIVNWIIVDRLYFKKSHRRDFYFTYMLISIAIFFLVFFMIFVLEDMKGKTSMGIGIGLFGIFSIMRYRTDTMPVREMTYLFVIICLSVVNALGATMSLAELLLTNIIVIAAIWLFERVLKTEATKIIQYDRIALITPERRSELIADLEERTGLKIDKVEVGAIDFLRDMAVIKIIYQAQGDETANNVNHKIKLVRQDLSDVNEK
jgi:hypothetical protein